MFQAEGIACMKALRLEGGWNLQGIKSRSMWLHGGSGCTGVAAAQG